jgi:hypothetical protein
VLSGAPVSLSGSGAGLFSAVLGSPVFRSLPALPAPAAFLPVPFRSLRSRAVSWAWGLFRSGFSASFGACLRAGWALAR